MNDAQHCKVSNPCVSVIVPAYNVEAYIAQCLESILNQTLSNIEIIVIDDGSTDSTGTVADEYAASHSNLTVRHKANGGVISARIAGLQIAKGDYIGWVDSDDFVSECMFETLFNLAVANSADYVYCNAQFYPSKPANKKVWFKDYWGKKDWRFIDQNTQCWNVLYSRALLDSVDIISALSRFEEYGWIAAMIGARQISYTSEKLYCYRVGHQSLSGGSYIGKLAHFKRGAQCSSELGDLIKGTEYEQSLRDYFEYRYIYSLMLLAIVATVNDDEQAYNHAVQELQSMGYNDNVLLKTILDENHGRLKSFYLRHVLPNSYKATRFIAKQSLTS